MKAIVAVLLVAGSCLALASDAEDRAYLRQRGIAIPVLADSGQQVYTLKTKDGERFKITLPAGLGIQNISIKTEDGRVVHGYIY